MRFTYKLNDSRSTEQVKKVGSIRSKIHIQYDVNERRMNGKKVNILNEAIKAEDKNINGMYGERVSAYKKALMNSYDVLILMI